MSDTHDPKDAPKPPPPPKPAAPAKKPESKAKPSEGEPPALSPQEADRVRRHGSAR